MRIACRTLLLFSAAACLPALLAYGQNAPSLADAARQTRQQNQQKDPSSNEAPAPKAIKVITDEDSPRRTEEPAQPSTSSDQPRRSSNATPVSAGAKLSADQWKSKILKEKNLISSLQSQVDRLNDSIHVAPANCVAGCARWNERQKRKQQEVERARAQLEERKKHLEAMQQAAHQQGYGNSVYDP